MRKLCVKVCGMREPENIRQVADLCPDYIGFIFAPESLRHIGVQFRPGFLEPLRSRIKAVGVFVNQSLDVVMSSVRMYVLDAVQLHGDENSIYCATLKQDLPEIQIIKAFALNRKFNFEALGQFEPCCSLFLFDAKGTTRGGTGKTFDWKILERYKGTLPYFLSGGITPQHALAVRELAASDSRLYGVDINSGFETAPGLKSIERIDAFMKELNA